MLTPQRYKWEGTICSRQSVRTGLRYEDKVCQELDRIFPGEFRFQHPVPGGIIDAIHPRRQIIVEIKLTQTADAYYQLERYAKHFPLPTRIVITKTVVRTISTPEPPIYLQRLSDIPSTEPGKYYVIPYVGKILK